MTVPSWVKEGRRVRVGPGDWEGAIGTVSNVRLGPGSMARCTVHFAAHTMPFLQSDNTLDLNLTFSGEPNSRVVFEMNGQSSDTSLWTLVDETPPPSVWDRLDDA